MAENNLVIVEREESLVSPKTNSPSFRKAHFLTPSATTSLNVAVSPPPPPSYKNLPLKVNFPCWRHSSKKWETWVEQMRALHHLTWEKAGIFNAIMSSKSSNIYRNEVLICGFVEKWCAVTNTFVFPWGEATVTLEDMIVLGGHSVLGDSVMISPNHDELVEKLVTEGIEMRRKGKAKQCYWMKRFMGSGSEIEHQVFLAYWLSRFVFPMKVAGRNVYSIAVRLSRGVRIALAPAVLAEVYQGLSFLKGAMVTAAMTIENGCGGGGEWDHRVVQASVSARLALVQVWIWERFPDLRPQPNVVGPDEPRIARWHNLRRKVDFKDLSLRMENFEWRPYVDHAGSSFFRGKTYLENGYWALVDDDLDEELEGWIRCLRTSELVGLDSGCIEQYLPHRVALQLGMDQDIPDYVVRENASCEIAWGNYNRPIIDEKVYVLPRLVEPGVTTRYLKWWNEINRGVNGKVEGGTYARSSSHADPKVEVTKYEALVPCSSNGAQSDLHGKCSFKSSDMIFIESDSSEGDSPPGFSPNRKRATVGSSGESGIYKKSKDGTNNIDSVPRQVSKQISSPTPSGAKISKTTFSESLSSTERVAQLSNKAESKDDDDVQDRIHPSSTEKCGTIEESTPLSLTHVQYEVMNTQENEQWINGVESSDTGCDIGGARLEERIVVLEKLCDLLKGGKLNQLLMKKSNK